MKALMHGGWRRLWCGLMVIGCGAVISQPAVGQGYGAIQAVRGRVSGLGTAPEGERPPGPPPGAGPGPQQALQGDGLAKLDTSYISSTAGLVVVLRPAQILASPLAQLLPTEVATAASQQYLGIDLSTVEEVVAFGEMPNPMAPTFGVAVKFNQPFRAASLPPHIRPMAKLAEFNGKKYLQSAHPLLPSFYGPNNKTLIAAPDAMLRKIVPASTEPKSGPLMDRLREAAAGNDLYLAVDMAAMRGILPLAMGSAGVAMPPKVKTIIDQTTAAELTLNLVSRGPVSFVLHCADDAAAQQVEQAVNELRQQQAATPEGIGPGPGPGPDPGSERGPGPGPEAGPAPPPEMGPQSPLQLAMTQYHERMMQRFQPQRNGTSIICLNIAADDPLQQQMFGIVVGAAMTAQQIPKIIAAQKAMGGGPKGRGAKPPAAAEPGAATPPGGSESGATGPDGAPGAGPGSPSPPGQ